MKHVYIYLLNTMADWETGYILQGLTAQTMVGEVKYQVKTVGITKEPIRTLGGMTMVPDCSIEEVSLDSVGALLLPGGETWKEEVHQPVLDLVLLCIDQKIPVAAICGATLALADLGVLNKRTHTSNSLEFLTGLSPTYTGSSFYVNEMAARDGNVITASSAGGLLWARYILESLNIYSKEVIDAWYGYFSTGRMEYFMELMEASQN
jgi:putative intracellular protease/amidase|uniref:DJ-1/PfpI family protein n=1 Tax=Clostridium sp. 12(A) TaxID=1163671 RepID=UPI000465E0B5|nr:DJ-1/PfpI family protein [Clostridium sp. 12(A)]